MHSSRPSRIKPVLSSRPFTSFADRAWFRIITGLILSAGLLLVLGGTPAEGAPTPTLWHVAPNGVDADGCGTLEQPCQRIATAIRNAIPNDTIVLAGGIYSETLEITKTLTLASAGPTQTVIDGNGLDSVIRIMSITTVLTITGVTIQHGLAPYGGGIDNFSGGDVHLVDTTVTSNTATTAAGGGIFNYGTMTLVNSTISDNLAATGGGIATNFGTLTITNTTISRNTATSGDERSGGGIFVGNGGLEIHNTLLAGNKANSGPDCAGALISKGYNLVGNNAGCTVTGATGDLIGTSTRPINPRLGPLDDYGGPTPTFTLRADSPAIDAGSDTSCPATDQRGIARPQLINRTGTARCDIGAYEYDALIVLPWLYLPSVVR